MTRRSGLFALAVMTVLRAAELRPETLSAWNQYVQSADAAMQARLIPEQTFLWIDEAPGRRQHLHDGEILVTDVGEHNPKKIPSGLIHHWIGAIFLPNARITDVLNRVRDYDHYKDYYSPNVMDSRAILQTPSSDRFSMLLMNKSLFVKKALESEYACTYAQAGSDRWYSMATAVRIQELEDYGQSNARALPPDEGSGYVWRLHNIARYLEADGGVYVEMEVMALSRDIPGVVRLMVDPIVRRVSRGALVTSLKQTLGAVTSADQVVAAPPAATTGLASGFLKSAPPHHDF